MSRKKRRVQRLSFRHGPKARTTNACAGGVGGEPTRGRNKKNAFFFYFARMQRVQSLAIRRCELDLAIGLLGFERRRASFALLRYNLVDAPPVATQHPLHRWSIAKHNHVWRVEYFHTRFVFRGEEYTVFYRLDGVIARFGSVSWKVNEHYLGVNLQFRYGI